MRTRTLRIGGFDHVKAVLIGGGHPVVIQTMWKDRLSFDDLRGEAMVRRIETLEKMGCGLLRFAVPDLSAAEALGNLASMVSMPLVADIHFDHKIALRCLDLPIAKIRINPGNMGSYWTPSGRDKIEAILSKAAANSRPIRIGVNAGSLPRDLMDRVDDGTLECADAMALAAEREIVLFDEFNFKNVVVSMKASSIADTIKANRIFAEKSDIPLHLGVTEAGPLIAGVTRNTAALAVLMREGIGDTIRVSLSDTMEKEVIAGREILEVVRDMAGNSVERGVRIVSCPRCGRSGFDAHAFTERWQNRLYAMDKNFTLAVMGCAVNGPTEARHADLGITGAGDKVLIFRGGKIIHTIDAAEADTIFEEELKRL
ncbi:MAG: (E)-4-hydroxy-3-methylbut-2-enyl-diphosphate synthase [Treponema sp.]|jgi:(E)-4-hydroxy-3-methylbut-2-enyl-diphosphate synthase|nr:(E)-4-hydroxy-3-methylbut-2-enyl-diphosphate synthase [Treponema sp.]